MLKEICVIGHPSPIGGAGTELDHQIVAWQAMGVVVHIVPLGSIKQHRGTAMDMENRCCVYHTPKDFKSIAGMHVINFCSKVFLQNLPTIRKFARSISWVNCMTFNFAGEVAAHHAGLIDFHLYQTDHQMEMLAPRLRDSTWPYRALRFDPFFNAEAFPFIEDRDPNTFTIGRISRDSTTKYAAHTFPTWNKITSPVAKKGVILGWGAQAIAKCGPPPMWVKTHRPNAITSQEFFRQCDVMVMSTDTTENLPRVGFEAMASGTVLVVDRRGGWSVLVRDGVTGWLCKDPAEMIYKASRCAFERNERLATAERAREMLDARWGLNAAMDSWARVFSSLERL
jgi:hypothetical protein